MRVLALLLFLSFFGASAAFADSDQDRARRAVQSGAVRPLGEILSVVQRRFPGRVLDAGLGQNGSQYFYDIRLLEGGRVTELRVDAGSAEVLGVRGSRREEVRRAEGSGYRVGPDTSLDAGRGRGSSGAEDPRSRWGADQDRRGGRRNADDRRGRGGGRDGPPR